VSIVRPWQRSCVQGRNSAELGATGDSLPTAFSYAAWPRGLHPDMAPSNESGVVGATMHMQLARQVATKEEQQEDVRELPFCVSNSRVDAGGCILIQESIFLFFRRHLTRNHAGGATICWVPLLLVGRFSNLPRVFDSCLTAGGPLTQSVVLAVCRALWTPNPEPMVRPWQAAMRVHIRGRALAGMGLPRLAFPLALRC
jgi:hypothetical protein